MTTVTTLHPATELQPTLDYELFGAPASHPAVEYHHWIGRCPTPGCKCNPIAAPHPTPTRCPRYGRRYTWKQVVGSHSDGIKCDARCQYAKGPSCDCSCAGRNHGAGWMA